MHPPFRRFPNKRGPMWDEILWHWVPPNSSAWCSSASCMAVKPRSCPMEIYGWDLKTSKNKMSLCKKCKKQDRSKTWTGDTWFPSHWNFPILDLRDVPREVVQCLTVLEVFCIIWREMEMQYSSPKRISSLYISNILKNRISLSSRS